MARPTAILIGPLGNRCLPWNGDTDVSLCNRGSRSGFLLNDVMLGVAGFVRH